MRRVQSEDNVAGLGTKALKRSVTMKQYITFEFVNLTEESVEHVPGPGSLHGKSMITKPRRDHDDPTAAAAADLLINC